MSATAVEPVAEPVRPLIPDLETRTVGFDDAEVREAGTSLIFEGHAAVFDSWSEDLGGFREKINRGAFRKVLRNGDDVRFLFNHNEDLIMARSTVKDGPGSLRLSEDSTGLAVEAHLVPTSTARDLRELTRTGVVSGMSYHFSMRDGGEDDWNDDYTERSIVQFGGIYDVGPVTYPAYQAAGGSMRSLVCGIEVVDDRGTVQEDLLGVIAARIHRGTIHASETERARVDAAFARIGRLSPWTEELARRTLVTGLADASASFIGGEGLADQLAASGQRTALAAMNARLIDRKLKLRGVTT